MSYFNAVELETRSIREALHEAASFVRGSLLDVGCGEKPYERLFAGRYTSYTGIDLETVQASRADVFADSLHLPFRSASFETVFSTQVIEHIRDPFLMMQEIGMVLKPGGHVIITAPQVWPVHEAPYDFFRYTRFGLAELAARAGLDVVFLRERHGGVYALAQIFCFMVYTKHKRSILLRILLKPVFFIVQSFAALLDRLYRYQDFTLGYILVARKKT